MQKQYLTTESAQVKINTDTKNTCYKDKLSTKKVLIFASGNGSNFEAIIRYFHPTHNTLKPLQDKENQLIKFELLVDNKNTYAIKRAQKLGIPYHYVKLENLYDFLKPRKYDLYVLAGYMQILPEQILNLGAKFDKAGHKIQNKFINIHPSLLPKYKGKNAISRAFEANEEKTGVTIHFVEKQVDSGEIITQKSVLAKGKTLAELEKTIHEIEHKIYPEIIENLLFKKNVLLFGGGAREHALAETLIKSPFLGQLYLAKANDGFKHLGKTIDFTDYFDLAKKACALNIDLLVVGPENPLLEGITDIFQKENIQVIGACKKWAMLEGSKSFAKTFMSKNGIKTADYKILENKNQIKPALEYFKAKSKIPPVIKADGAALGKGVCLPENFEEAELEITNFLDGKFGSASIKTILEERLFGKEVSIISLWDGKTLISFPPASDYKRLLDNNKGPNTGGMGAIAPSKISIKEKKQIKEYLKTLETALKKENANFTGIIYSGLILTEDGVYVLEYNMRFGDPETQALLELLDTSCGADLLYIFIKMAGRKLNEVDIKFTDKKAYCVVLASKGYPENPKKGAKIKNLNAANKYNCKVYFAGVKTSINRNNPAVQPAKNLQITDISDKNKISFILKTNSADIKNFQANLTTNGGRVLSIVKSGINGKSILDKIYKTVAEIDFDGKIFRRDIGKS